MDSRLKMSGMTRGHLTMSGMTEGGINNVGHARGGLTVSVMTGGSYGPWRTTGVS